MVQHRFDSTTRRVFITPTTTRRLSRYFNMAVW